MGVNDWNWRLEADPQDYPWDCSAASIAWCLRTIGMPYDEADVIAGLGSTRISPTYGLLDASGAGLVEYLGEIGVVAQNNPYAEWADVVAAGGYQPMAIGGRAWNHWVAVRMAGPATGSSRDLPLILMNPADGYMGVYQFLNEYTFYELGPFSAVWFTSW